MTSSSSSILRIPAVREMTEQGITGLNQFLFDTSCSKIEAELRVKREFANDLSRFHVRGDEKLPMRSPVALEAIFSHIQQSTTELVFTHCRFSSDCFQVLCAKLRDFHALHALKFDGCEFSIEQVKQLAPAVARLREQLVDFRLVNNPFKNEARDVGLWHHFASFLKDNNCLSRLDLSGNEIDDDQLEVLLEIDCLNIGLMYLGLNKNSITSQGVRYITTWLTHMSFRSRTALFCQSIGLKDNRVDDAGLHHLYSYAKRFCFFTFDLNGNGISAKGKEETEFVRKVFFPETSEMPEPEFPLLRQLLESAEKKTPRLTRITKRR